MGIFDDLIPGGMQQGPNGIPRVTITPRNQPRGIRNNNQGNIEDGPFARSQPGYAGSDGRFAKYDSPDAGLAAMENLLSSYGRRGIDTTSGVINRWAPASDNNPVRSYSAFVSEGMGVKPDDKIDLNDQNVRRALVDRMAQFETGQPVNRQPQASASQANPFEDLIPQEAPSQQIDAVAQPQAPKVGQGEALARGAAQGVTANFYDELRGLMEAGGLDPKDPASLSSLIQGAYKYWTGDADAAKRYDTATSRERQAMKAAEEQYPGTSLAGNVAGAVALPLGGVLRAPTLAGRAMRGAAVGAGMGATYGAGEGVDATDRASRALVGGGTGFALGGVAPPLIEGAIKGVGAVASRPINMLRAAVNPSGAAERAVGRAYREAVETDPFGATRMTAAELDKQGQGGPAMVIDTLGGEGRNLARSAANLSGGARDTLNRSLDDRFEGQAGRFTGWLQRKFNFPDAHAQQKAIDSVEKTVNSAAYKKAYQAGDKPIWSPELERIVGSDAVVAGMREAAVKGKDRAIAQGYGGFNPPVRVTPDGRVEFLGKGGAPTYPNIQFWDYTYRAVRDKAKEAMRAGRTDEASRIGDVARLLRDELDRIVPEYQTARGVAASFFGAENALEAGQKFVLENFSIPKTRDALGKMTAPERMLFQDGFVSRFVETLNNVSDRADVVKRIYNTPAAREKIQLVLGKQRALELEAMVRLETIMQMSLRAVQGNSTTAMQLLGAGLAGSTGGGVLGYDPTVSGIAAALATAGKRGIDARVAQKIAEMLTSKDPAVLNRGMKMVASNQKFMNALRSFDAAGSRIGGGQAPNSLAGPSAPAIGRAEDNQPAVPRPPGQ